LLSHDVVPVLVTIGVRKIGLVEENMKKIQADDRYESVQLSKKS